MSPKEKSEELFHKFYELPIVDDNPTNYDLAKKCSLIAVQEILNQDAEAFDPTEREYHFEYWGHVKDEIEKL